MRILIRDHLKPFSHIPGTVCLLPHTFYQCRIYPALIEIYDVKNVRPELIKTIPVKLPGPVEQFTVQFDMEKGSIRVWGFSSGQFFRYRIFGQGEIFPENLFASSLFEKGVAKPEFGTESIVKERLSLGIHKSQDVEQIRKRGDIHEFFPFWFRLGQLVPKIPKAKGGVFDLLDECMGLGQFDIVKAKQLFAVAFRGIFSPSLVDEEHLGFSLSKANGSPISLVQEGASWIRSLFFQQVGNTYLILPKLPMECRSGKLVGFVSEEAVFDIEWTKNCLRRMVIFGEKEGLLRLILPKGIRKFRFREMGSKKESTMKSSENLLSIAHEKIYFIDRIET